MSIITPFLAALSIQLPKFNEFFEVNENSISIESDGSALERYPNMIDFADAVSHVENRQSLQIIRLVYNWNCYVGNRNENLSLDILFDLRSQHRFVCRWGLYDNVILDSEADPSSATLIDIPYDAIRFSDREVSDQVKVITDIIYAHIKKLVREN